MQKRCQKLAVIYPSAPPSRSSFFLFLLLTWELCSFFQSYKFAFLPPFFRLEDSKMAAKSMNMPPKLISMTIDELALGLKDSQFTSVQLVNVRSESHLVERTDSYADLYCTNSPSQRALESNRGNKPKRYRRSSRA